MAFNLGAALGAATQSGINTYTKLGEEQRQEEELAMRRKEAAYQEEQRNQERELNKISALTLGAGDKRTVADQSTVNQGYEGADGPAATGYKEVVYTPQQQMADFKQRALSAGIPLQKVTAISSAHRAEKYAEKEEMALEFNNQVMNDIKANPNDLGAVFKKHFEPLYNEGKLPGLNDGSKVELIPDGKGGQSMLFKDSKGKPTQPPVPLDIHAMEAITQKWGDLMMKSSSPANYWKSRETDLKSREVGAKEALVPSEIAKNQAAAGYYTAHGKALGEAAGGKPTSRTVMVGGGVDSASGVATPKQPVTIVTKFDKNGAPVVSAYDLSGKPITDQKVLGQAQMAAAQGGGDEGNAPLSAIGADLASARKRYESGNLSLDEYNKEVAAIKLMGGLPKPGGSLNPNAGAATAPALSPVQPRAIAYTKGGFERWVDAAKSGTPADKALGREILQGWVNNNELSVGEKQQALKLLK